MAVSNIGLSLTTTPGSQSTGLLIRSSSTPQDVKLLWHTIASYGTGWNDKFGIAVAYSVVPRGVTGGDGGYGPWVMDGNGADGWWYAEVSEDDCAHSASEGGGTDWAHSLDVASIFEEIFPNGLAYANREYDQIRLSVAINAIYASGLHDPDGSVNSPTSYGDLYVGYAPTPTLTGASLTPSHLVIEYSPDGWERPRDIFRALSLSQGGRALAPGAVDGQTGDPGEARVPLSALSRVPSIGQPLDVSLDFAPTYRGFFGGWASLSGTTTVADGTRCNTPVLSVAVDDDAGELRVTVTDSGDLGKPIASAVVSLDGGQLAIDSADVAPGGTVTLYPPLDERLVVTCLASGADGTTSAASVRVPAIMSRLRWLVTREDGGGTGAMRVGVQTSRTFSREMEDFKLRGRQRSSVFFGDGSSVTRQLTGTLRKHDPGVAFFGRLADARLVVVREPWGGRYEAAVSGATSTPGYSTTEVTLNMTEVADGRIAD